MKFPSRVLSGLFLLMFSLVSSAAMMVERTVVHFTPDGPARQDVQITNPDAETLYLKVEALEVINPGAENEERRIVTNPKELGFLVTPNKMAIPPGASKVIRLVNTAGLTDSERVIRVNLTPVVGDLEAEQTGVKIVIGYQLLVFMHPQVPEPTYEAKREGTMLNIVNTGNINLLFHRGTQCQPAPLNEECTDAQTVRVYPGQQTTIELADPQLPVNYIMTAGTSNQAVQF